MTPAAPPLHARPAGPDDTAVAVVVQRERLAGGRHGTDVPPGGHGAMRPRVGVPQERCAAAATDESHRATLTGAPEGAVPEQAREAASA